MFALVFFLGLAGCGGGGEADIEWSGKELHHSRVTTYVDGSAIPAAKIPTIAYRVYYGTSATGPWTRFNTHRDNVAAMIPAAGFPACGSTMYYTCDVTLDGSTSAKAPPIAYTGECPDAPPTVAPSPQS